MRVLLELPTWFLCVVIMAVAISFNVVGVFIVRRRGWMLNTDDNVTAGYAHAFVGVLYAVALGLIVVGVQGGYAEVESAATREASVASDMYTDLEGFSDPERIQLQGLMSRYITSVVDKEWAKVGHGEVSEETWALMDSIARGVIVMHPATPHGELIYPEILTDANQVLDARRERLFLGSSGVGTLTWLIVLIGAIIIFAVAWFFNTPSATAHYALVTAMAAMFGLMIFLILAMDHPLWGSFSVQPDAFRAVQKNIVRWENERSTPTPQQMP